MVFFVGEEVLGRGEYGHAPAETVHDRYQICESEVSILVG